MDIENRIVKRGISAGDIDRIPGEGFGQRHP
jgi:hypothetical protein